MALIANTPRVRSGSRASRGKCWIDSLEERPDLIVDHDLSGDTYVVEGPALRSALKGELRRLVTPR
jgi:hypothetical protein